MEELKALITQIRNALDIADLEDEAREEANTAVEAVEELFKSESEKRQAEPTPEPAPEVDLTPVASALESLAEVTRELAEGQKAIKDELEAQRKVEPEPVVEPEPEPEPDRTDERFTKLEESIDSLTTLIKDTVPVRRGEGPKKEEKPKDELDIVKEALESEENPEVRLRSIVGHVTGDRPIEG
jgi:hypothetical protein